MEKKEKKSKEKKDKKSKTPEATAAKSAPPSAAATPALAGGVTPGGPTATGAREPQAGEQSVVDGLLTVRVIPECPYVCVPPPADPVCASHAHPLMRLVI